MDAILSLAADNLLSPIILSFVLGLAAAYARSDLSVPEAVAKGLSLYLLFAIGFKGGASVAAHGIDQTLILSLVAGLVLSFSIPVVAFGLLRVMSGLDTVDAAAVAAHYGSISIVTFVAGSSVLTSAGLEGEGYMVAVAAVMEAPAILSALWLIARSGASRAMDGELMREVMLNGSIVLLVGAFLIGWRRVTVHDIGGLGLLYRGSGGDARGAARGEPVDLPDALAWRDIPLQPDPGHTDLPGHCPHRDRRLTPCRPTRQNGWRSSSRR